MPRLRLLIGVILILFILPLFTNIGGAEPTTPIVWSNRKEYPPSRTVHLFGYNFNPLTQVNITIVRPDMVEDKLQTSTDEFGYFSCLYPLDGIHGVFNVTATDGVNVATTTFRNCLYLRARWNSHEGCLGIQVKAGGLCTYGDGDDDDHGCGCNNIYYVKYFDPAGVEKRQSPNYTGVHSFTDNLIILPTFPNILGWWTVKLYQNGVVVRTKCVYIDRMVWTTDSSYTNMVTSFAQGETVYFKTIGLNPSKYYRFKLEMPNGTMLYVGSWTTGVTSMTGSYPLPSNAPLGTWKIHVRKASDSSGTCERHYVDCSFEVTTAPPPEQYYLTIQTDPTGIGTIQGEGWYNECTTVNVTAPEFFPSTTGIRYSFDYWDLDGVSQGMGIDEISVHMDANHTATAHYHIQYFLNVTVSPKGVTIPSGEGWYDADSNASIFTPEFVSITPGASRYRFDGWTTSDMSEIANASATSTTVFVDKPKTVVANYVVQYHVTFDQTGLDGSASGTVVTVDGAPKTYPELPHSFWIDNGTVVTYSYSSIVSSSTSGKRFSLINVTGPVSPVTVTSQVTVTGNYKTQYYLTVSSPYGIPGGEDWYDSGSTAYATLDTGLVDHGNGTRRVFTHWSGDASGTDYSQSNPITMNGPKTATANWKTQYHLTVSSPYGAPGGEGWYDSGDTAYATLATGIVDHGNGTRRVFTNWSGDASGTNYAQSNPITMDKPKTATANWKTQYRVTFDQTGLDSSATGTVVTIDGTPRIFSDLPYSFWVDSSDVVTYSYDNVSSTAVGKRFTLTGVTGPASPTTVTNPVTVTGNYKIQYQITFDQSGVGTDFTGTVVTIDATDYGVGDLPESFWWDSGTDHTFSFGSPLVVNASYQYTWVSTSGLTTLQSDTLTITGSGSVTGHYSAEVKYQITFYQTGVGPDFTGTVVTIDSVNYGVSSLPASFLWDDGSSHSFSFQSPLVVTPNAKQYVWISTTGLSSSQSGSITVSESGNITGNCKTQYYLTVSSPYGTPGGEGWYDSGSTANATLDTGLVDHGNGTRRVFTHWSGDASGTDYAQSDPITMDGPKTAVAIWKTQYYLTLMTNPPGVDAPTGSGWYDNCTYAPISTAMYEDIVAGESRYKFAGWTTPDMTEIDDPASTSTTVHMDKAKTVTANYVTQYYLTVLSPYDTPSGEGWYDSGDTAYATLATGIVDHGNGTRRVFTNWSGDASGTNYAQSNPITMDGPKTAIANWKTQFYLTVRTDPAGLSPVPTPPSNWYDGSTNVDLTAPDPSYLDSDEYNFTHWDVDGNTVSGNPITVHMDMPHTAIAHYEGPPSPPPVCVGGEIILVNTGKPVAAAPMDLVCSLLATVGVAVILVSKWKKRRQ